MVAVLETTNDKPKTSVDKWTLKAIDRCDRCGAQAYVRVTFLESTQLQFCGHHFAKFEKQLPEVAYILDERGQLDTGNRHQGSANS